MTDAFDHWIEWAKKSPGNTTGLPAEIHAIVRSLPREDRADRQKVNAAVGRRAELSRTGKTAWLYLNDYRDGKQQNVGDPEWVKVFASSEAADRWFGQHDPEGVAWEYEIEGGLRQTSVWIYLPDENSRAIGDASWAKLFASKQAADNWLEQNAPNSRAWSHPVDD
jgi:hypothetical protein